MAYTDFGIANVADRLGVTTTVGDAFGPVVALPVPAWLTDALARGQRQALLSEKARSEFIVAPVLMAAQELSATDVAIYSGQRLDVDPARGLVGECDFILAAGPALPGLAAPLLTVVEAKRNEIESGVWQCLAQMVGAAVFNEQAGRPLPAVFGCVTNGEVWLFLRLVGTDAVIERRRFYINEVGSILAVFRMAMDAATARNP